MAVFSFGPLHLQRTIWLALLLFLLTLLLFSSSNFVKEHSGNARIAGLQSSANSKRCDTPPLPPRIADKRAAQKAWTRVQDVFDQYDPAKPWAQLQVSPRSIDEPVEAVLPTTKEEAQTLRTLQNQVHENIPPFPETVFSGRGVVMIASEKRAEFAATSIGMLRMMGSQLPIELWFDVPQNAKSGWCKELEQQRVACRYVSDYTLNQTAANTTDDHVKYTALLFSSFLEVLYLDPETIVTTAPDNLFDGENYQQKGLIMWADFWESTQSPWTDYVVGTSNVVPKKRTNHGTLDGGVVLFDKRKHWKTMVLTSYYVHHYVFFYPFLSSRASSDRGFPASLDTAVRAMQLPYQRTPLGPTQVYLSKDNGDKHGSGVCVLLKHPDTNSLLFLRTNILRFGHRRLMCDSSCVEPRSTSRPHRYQRLIGQRIRTMGSFVTSSDFMYKYLHEGRQVLSRKQLQEMQQPYLERNIWMVLEKISCVGVWSEDGICSNVRTYIDMVYGYVDYWRPSC
jgi:alpha 1,2-mannosyltransferase